MRLATLDDYRWLYQHGYMRHSRPWFDAPFLHLLSRHPKRIIDVGGGTGAFKDWMEGRIIQCEVTNVEQANGDPFLPAIPESYARECVTCFDVLEHIDCRLIDASLQNLRSLTKRIFVCSIANMSDVHTVNGEDVELHVTRMPADWWLDRIRESFPGFDIQLHHLDYQYRFWIIAEAM